MVLFKTFLEFYDNLKQAWITLKLLEPLPTLATREARSTASILKSSNSDLFSELRRRCRGIRLDIVPVDLRWGLPNDRCPLEACLNAIDTCQIFVGIVGDRRGYVPETVAQHSESRFMF